MEQANTSAWFKCKAVNGSSKRKLMSTVLHVAEQGQFKNGSFQSHSKHTMGNHASNL